MFGGPVIVLSKYCFYILRLSFMYSHLLRNYTCCCVVGGNTKREQGRKVQESNVAAAKVSDNMMIFTLPILQHGCVLIFTLSD